LSNADLGPLLRQQFLGADGEPLAGGKLYSYASGTTTPLATYTDYSGLTPNTNPIILDASGTCNVWIGDTPYKFVLTDADDVLQWTVDPVQSLRAQIASQINISGALAIANNLSDLANATTAVQNLGVAPFFARTSYPVTNGQGASNLSGQTFDGASITSVFYAYEITQGTTIMATGDFSCHYKNGTWVLLDGMSRGDAHGVTFSLSQTTTVGQLKAAESGLGNGTIKLKRHYIAA
jgi:hypothetical protein